jgi:hypothetical protein
MNALASEIGLGMSDEPAASRFELSLRRDGGSPAIHDLNFQIRLLP